MRHPISPKLFFASVSLCLTIAVSDLSAQPGSFDSSFGNGGVATAGVLSGSSRNGVIDSQGRILMLLDANGGVGEMARFNADGTPDGTFGTGGVRSFNWQSGIPFMLALQNDGGFEKILIAGSTYVPTGRRTSASVLRVDRFMPDGTPDTTFDNDGSVVHSTGYALAVAVQPDGKIVTVGDQKKLVRLNTNGSLDGGFGSGGIVDIAVVGRALAIQSDSKIVVAGSYTGKGNKVTGSVARFAANGAVDNSFGASGRATVPSVNNHSVAVDLSGRIVVGGNIRQSDDQSSYDLYLARLASTGQLDPTFGSDGYLTHDFFGTADWGYGLALQADGKIVAGGHSYGSTTGGGDSLFSMARFNADGSLDAGFGNAGSVVLDPLPLENRGSYCRSILISGSKLVMPGYSYANTGFVHYATVAQFYQ